VLEHPAVDELIGRASRLSAEQIVSLAASTRRTMGRGLKAYLGISSSAFRAVNSSAAEALKRANLEAEMRAKVTLLNRAVLSASVEAAKRQGRDTTGVQEAWQHFERAVDAGDGPERKNAYRSAKKVFRRGLGRQLTRQWPIASVGAAWALLALLTWGQAMNEGTYTIRGREILTRPWVTVSSLPL
jgi:hypothetical protein